MKFHRKRITFRDVRFIWKHGSIFSKAYLDHCQQLADLVQDIHFDNVGSARIKWLPYFGANMYSNSMFWDTVGPPSSDHKTFGFSLFNFFY